MTNKYTTSYFIKKFSRIEPDLWTEGSWKDGEKCCALGHCGERSYGQDGRIRKTPESKKLRALFDKYLGKDVTSVNDDFDYTFETPKARILNALWTIFYKTQKHTPKKKRKAA